MANASVEEVHICEKDYGFRGTEELGSQSFEIAWAAFEAGISSAPQSPSTLRTATAIIGPHTAPEDIARHAAVAPFNEAMLSDIEECSYGSNGVSRLARRRLTKQAERKALAAARAQSAPATIENQPPAQSIRTSRATLQDKENAAVSSNQSIDGAGKKYCVQTPGIAFEPDAKRCKLKYVKVGCSETYGSMVVRGDKHFAEIGLPAQTAPLIESSQGQATSSGVVADDEELRVRRRRRSSFLPRKLAELPVRRRRCSFLPRKLAQIAAENLSSSNARAGEQILETLVQSMAPIAPSLGQEAAVPSRVRKVVTPPTSLGIQSAPSACGRQGVQAPHGWRHRVEHASFGTEGKTAQHKMEAHVAQQVLRRRRSSWLPRKVAELAHLADVCGGPSEAAPSVTPSKRAKVAGAVPIDVDTAATPTKGKIRQSSILLKRPAAATSKGHGHEHTEVCAID